MLQPQPDADGDTDQKVTGWSRWTPGESNMCVQSAESVTERHGLCVLNMAAATQITSSINTRGGVAPVREVRKVLLPAGTSSPLAGSRCWSVQTAG